MTKKEIRMIQEEEARLSMFREYYEYERAKVEAERGFTFEEHQLVSPVKWSYEEISYLCEWCGVYSLMHKLGIVSDYTLEDNMKACEYSKLTYELFKGGREV